MRIGLDFDNTIVSYDQIFYAVAQERIALPAGLPINKLAVRDHLRDIDQEDLWTELQGYVYGQRMKEATPYPGVIEFIQNVVDAGHTVRIISHKTRHPYRGFPYDLHASARAWIDDHLSLQGVCLVDTFFEVTKEQKINRILDQRCDVFVDDLPEILLSDFFPSKTRRILFDPQQSHSNQEALGIQVFSSWHVLAECVLACKQ